MPDPSVTAVPDLTVDGQSIPSDPPTPNDSGTSDRLLIDLSTADQDLIKKVQTALRGLSLYSGRIDGFTGPLTEAAIRSFQRQSGDPATGVLTTPQYNELLRPK
jgi:peptidoglycan hydrolase-like protein with peptidoglycan-binding domain